MNKQLTVGVLLFSTGTGALEYTGGAFDPINMVMIFAALAGLALIVTGAMTR